MGSGVSGVILLVALPVCAGEVYRKPSPFPEKNREREPKAAPPLPRRTADPPGRPVAAADGTGVACFFSTRAGGRSDELAAAHATYPKGSRVKVTNLASGKTVEVQITGRFPDSRRIITVSEAAARRLGFYEAGTAEVKVEPVRDSPAQKGTEER